MNVTLTPELSAYVESKIKAGEYSTAEDLIRHGVQTLKELEEQDSAALETLRREIKAGIEEADRGEMEEIDDGVMERIRATGRVHIEI